MVLNETRSPRTRKSKLKKVSSVASMFKHSLHTPVLKEKKRKKKSLAQISEERELTGRVSSDYFAQTKPLQTPTYFYNHIPPEADYKTSPSKRVSQPALVTRSNRSSANTSEQRSENFDPNLDFKKRRPKSPKKRRPLATKTTNTTSIRSPKRHSQMNLSQRPTLSSTLKQRQDPYTQYDQGSGKARAKKGSKKRRKKEGAPVLETSRFKRRRVRV